MTQESKILPEGAVTFLLTDIEKSAAKWETYPLLMPSVLARHDALAEACFAAHSGFLVKSKGEGDSAFAVFARASDALAAVVAFQRALQEEAWPAPIVLRVRAALHTGEALLREGDYYGAVVNRCARLRGLAHGGQILLSEAAQELARDALPPQVSLRDMGRHRMRDLTRPEQVFQVLHPALPAEFPLLASLDVLPNNLPSSLTRFIGRDLEMVEVKRLLGQTRLLTVMGSGGCGKTRMALQIAADLLENYPDGVWFAALENVTDPARLPQTVADALHIQEEPGRALTDTLTAALREKKILLLLDNCEHLTTGCIALLKNLLPACPGLNVLATSREALGIAGETTWQALALSVPPVNRPVPLAELANCEAAALFVERAQSVHPAFALTPQNAPAVAQICRQLDGIPLAIELAACRLRVLSPEQIAARLKDRFRLLAGGNRAALPRHQTLRAAMDWSYDLLAEPEKTLLRRLSALTGVWRLETAEALGAEEPGVGVRVSGIGNTENANSIENLKSVENPTSEIRNEDVLDLLTLLIEKSLVVKEEQEGEARYRMLATVRQYGQERAREAGEWAAAALRHRAYFLNAALQAGAAQADALDTLARDRDNFHAALLYCRKDSGGAADALRLANALYPFWAMRGHFQEGREAFADAIEQANALSAAPDYARALNGVGSLAWSQCDYAAARSSFEQALALRRALGDPLGIADTLNNLGNVAWNQGDYAAARPLFEESLQILRGQEDAEGIAAALGNLALMACEQNELDAAQALFEESIAIDRRLNNACGIAASLDGLGEIALRRQDFALSRSLREDSLKMRRELQDAQGVAEGLEGMAAWHGAQAQPEFAVALLGAADRLRETIGCPLPPKSQAAQEQLLRKLRHALPEAAFAAAWTKGRALEWEAAVTATLENFTLPDAAPKSATAIVVTFQMAGEATAKKIPPAVAAVLARQGGAGGYGVAHPGASRRLSRRPQREVAVAGHRGAGRRRPAWAQPRARG